MSDQFEWKTEEEDASVWDEQGVAVPVPEVGKRPYKTWLLLLLLLLIAVAVIYGQVQQRVEVATADVRADLLSTHNLINRAVTMQDETLLAPLLSGRDMAWTQDQERMMREDALFGRTALGLPLAQPLTDLREGDEQFSLELAPDLNSAVLQFVGQYQLGDEEIALQQTAVYRRGADRWLLAPPEDEFWGAWETVEIDGMSFVFPARDAEIGTQLAQQLATNILARCAQLDDLECPDLDALFVRFATDSASLVAMSDPATLYDANLRLDLPTPTLLGLPVDEAGFAALVQVYEAQIFTAVLSEAIGYTCCRYAPFVQALNDYYLAEIGLKSWPVSQEMYTQIANQPLSAERLFVNWSEASFLSPWDEEYGYVYGFVDFLMRSNGDKTGLQIWQQLNSRQGAQAGLAGLFGGQYGNGVLLREAALRDWWVYAQAKSLGPVGERPLPFPDQDLQIVCSQNRFGTQQPISTLYRYDLETDSWQEELTQSGFLSFWALPQDNGLILQQIDFEQDDWQTVLWQNGTEKQVVGFFTGQTDPTGQLLVTFAETPPEGQLQLVDLNGCGAADCLPQTLLGTPIWSPNGERTLLITKDLFEDPNNDFAPFPIRLGDRFGQPLLGEEVLLEMGNAPFWLDDEMFGFIRLGDDPTNRTQELVIGQAGDAVVRTLISTTNLLNALPEAERPVRLAMQYVVANPTDATMLAVMAVAQQNGYLFMVDQESGAVELRMQVRVDATPFFSFSPDGRFLVLSGQIESERNNATVSSAIFVHDIVANESKIFEMGVNPLFSASLSDWSADGRWLTSVYGNGFLWLYAPEYEYQLLLEHDFGDCTSLAWVN